MAFGKSNEIKRLPTSNVIREFVSDEDIFKKYLGGKLPQGTIKSPLREENNPSFSLFHSNKHNKVMFKDFATGEVGDCFVFVKRLFGFTLLTDAFNKIAYDFQLPGIDYGEFKINSSEKVKPIKLKPRKNIVDFRENPKVGIDFQMTIFSEKDKKYWSQFGITLYLLKKCNVYPISSFSITKYGSTVHYSADDLAYVFIENKDNKKTYKIYQPHSKVRKWANNNDYSTWELWDQLPEQGENLIIASGRKDAMTIIALEMPGISACALQSEGVRPKQSVIDELRLRFKNIYILYDNDYDKATNHGLQKSISLSSIMECSFIKIPKKYESKDISLVRKKHGKAVTIGFIQDALAHGHNVFYP